MAQDLNPFAYRPGTGPLHRMPGTVKLLLLFVLSLSAFLGGIPGLGAGSFLTAAGSLLGKVPLPRLFRGSRMVLVSAVLVILFRSLRFSFPFFNVKGFIEGLLFGWGLMLSFSACALLFSVTTMTELKESLSRIEAALLYPLLFLTRRSGNPAVRKLGERFFRPRISLGVSLMLGFLPRFFEIWDNASDAYALRGGKGGVKKIFTLIPLVSEYMLEAAAGTAEALELRGTSL